MPQSTAPACAAVLSAIAFAEAAAPKDHGENRSIMDLARAFFCAPAENRQIEPGITITIAAIDQDCVLYDVEIVDERDRASTFTYTAREALFVPELMDKFGDPVLPEGPGNRFVLSDAEVRSSSAPLGEFLSYDSFVVSLAGVRLDFTEVSGADAP